MAGVKLFSKLKLLLTIIFVFTLSTFFVFFSSVSYEIQREEFELFVLPKSGNTETNSRLKNEEQLKSKILNTTDRTNANFWQDYQEHWNGEILLNSDPKKKDIVFTEAYKNKMVSKGLHPLCIKNKRYSNRIQRIEKYCSEFPSQERYVYGEGLPAVLYSDKAKLLACSVPKVASTNWANMFFKMFQLTSNVATKVTGLAKFEWIALKFNDSDERLVAMRYQTYTKFFISRNPFERLLSAYVDKFTTKNNYYEPTFAPEIIQANYLTHLDEELIKQTRKNLKEGNTDPILGLTDHVIQQIKRLEAGLGNYNITLMEFLNYILVISAQSGRESLEYHWRPITLICNPCKVRYDFIAKFETLYEDSQLLLNYVQPNFAQNTLQFPKFDSAISKDQCYEAFVNIPRDMRNKLYRIYEEDFILFGYNQDQSENPDNILC